LKANSRISIAGGITYQGSIADSGIKNLAS
jgi:hypothetical protein